MKKNIQKKSFDQLIIYCAGGMYDEVKYPNGPTGAGFVITEPGGKILYELGSFVGPKGNKILGLCQAIKLALETVDYLYSPNILTLNIDDGKVVHDLEKRIIPQESKEAQELFTRIYDLADKYHTKIHLVPAEENSRAKKLAATCYDAWLKYGLD